MIQSIHYIIDQQEDAPLLVSSINSIYHDIQTFNIHILIHTIPSLLSFLQSNIKFDQFISFEFTTISYSNGLLIPLNSIFCPNTLFLLNDTDSIDTNHSLVLEMTEEIFSNITDLNFDFNQQKIFLLNMKDEFPSQRNIFMNIILSHIGNFLNPTLSIEEEPSSESY